MEKKEVHFVKKVVIYVNQGPALDFGTEIWLYYYTYYFFYSFTSFERQGFY